MVIVLTLEPKLTPQKINDTRSSCLFLFEFSHFKHNATSKERVNVWKQANNKQVDLELRLF